LLDELIIREQGHVVNDIDPTIPAMSRRIDLHVLAGFQLLDLTGPLTVFEFAEEIAPGSYRTAVISEAGGAVTASSSLEVTTASPSENRDTLIIVGGYTIDAATASQATVDAVRLLASRSRRTASVCTGAILLAATGLLDGRRATTHWRFAVRLQSHYPKVKVDADKIFIKDGAVWTSAGITAGIDLALALVEDDLGVDVSRAVAREMVVYHRRPGGQSQFSALLDMEASSHRVRAALQFARDHLAEKLSIERLADAAGVSPRQFSRAFLAETGQTPAKAVERLRVEAARPGVEEGVEPLEEVARRAGFADPERMRQGFIRIFGQPPQAIRRAARR